MVEENDNVEYKDVAITLKKLVPLFDLINGQFEAISSKVGAYPPSWYKFQVKTYLKVGKKSVKEILKKNPVNIEMPKLKAVGNGQIKQVYSNKKEKKEDDEIIVHVPDNEFPKIEDF